LTTIGRKLKMTLKRDKGVCLCVRPYEMDHVERLKGPHESADQGEAKPNPWDRGGPWRGLGVC
jgi:hypothetical protein